MKLKQRKYGLVFDYGDQRQTQLMAERGIIELKKLQALLLDTDVDDV